MNLSLKERLDEIDQKYSKPEKKKKKKKQKQQPKPGGLNGILQKFNEQQAKGNAKTTLLKTLADLAGVGLGTAVSAAAGKAAPLIGAALIGTGHYIGDDSGLLRVVGAATVAHSVAKSKEYRQEGSTMKDRLSGLKDDWLRVAMLKHEEQKNQNVAPTTKTEAIVEFIPPTVKSEPTPPAPKPKAESIYKPNPTVTVQTPVTERRKTPYEIEIDQRLFDMQEESRRLEAELEEYDFPPDDFDNSTDNDFNDSNFAPLSQKNVHGKTLWPPTSPNDYGEYLEDDSINFDEY